MTKLYKRFDSAMRYWETWEQGDGSHVVHHGVIGQRGQSTVHKTSALGSPTAWIQSEIDRLLADGYAPIPLEEHGTLRIDYAIEGHGSALDLERRHRLEDRLNETLGWTGLGHCDGGSIGSGGMEVFCFVVDFAVAKRTIEADLRDTEFADFTRIVDEDAEAE